MPPSIAELVADLVATTGLLPAEKLAAVRAGGARSPTRSSTRVWRRRTGSRACSPLAARHQLPLVDLPVVGVVEEAAKLGTRRRWTSLVKARIPPEAAADGIAFYRKKGSPRCGQSGYRGRFGVFQLLIMSEALEQLAIAKASREDIEREAISEGMRTLWDDGIAKVAAGYTSIDELARVSV